MKSTIEQIKKIREETSAPIADIRNALEASKGNESKAKEWLRKKGFERADKKGEREVKAGTVQTYLHATGNSGATVVLLTETDFVSRTDEFKTLAREIAMQVCAMNPENEKELLSQPYIRDAGKTVGELIKENIAKFGENIQLKDFKRFQV
ncbi:MAG: elongation factor Ts [bacterium]|nr:elongation factor Ts [bacterium]